MFAHYLLQDQRNSSVPGKPEFRTGAAVQKSERCRTVHEHVARQRVERGPLRLCTRNPGQPQHVAGFGLFTHHRSRHQRLDDRRSHWTATNRLRDRIPGNRHPEFRQPWPRRRPGQKHDPPDRRQSDLDSRQACDESRFRCPLHDGRCQHGQRTLRTNGVYAGHHW